MLNSLVLAVALASGNVVDTDITYMGSTIVYKECRGPGYCSVYDGEGSVHYGYSEECEGTQKVTVDLYLVTNVHAVTGVSESYTFKVPKQEELCNEYH